MVTVTINGETRTSLGKSSTKEDRNSGKIPCVLYGGSSGNIHFTTCLNDVRDLVYTPDFKIAQINVEGKSYRCILKEIQFNPINDQITHIDFLELTNGRTIKVEVPLRFEGISAGVRAGGKLVQKLRKVKIKTKPEFLVAEVKADISNLGLGQSLRIKDISPIEGVEILNSPTLPIAAVTVPRGLRGGEK